MRNLMAVVIPTPTSSCSSPFSPELLLGFYIVFILVRNIIVLSWVVKYRELCSVWKRKPSYRPLDLASGR